MRGGVPVARRNILFDRRRLATGVFGVGAAIALIFLLQGLWGGVQVQISAYAENVGADLFVGDKGTQTTSESSTVPLAVLPAIRVIPGVAQADPIVARSTILTFHDRKVFTALVGYEPGRIGGPWRVLEGRAVTGDDEAVLDRTLARQHDVRIGDEVEVMGEQFRVVGLSGGTRTWMSAYVFVSHDAGERLFRTTGTTNFVLVRTDRPNEVAREIEQRLGLTTLTVPELVGNTRELFAGIMKGPLELMVLIAFAAGTLIVALTVYSQVIERVREYGIVKAMGARGRRLFAIVLGQTMVVAVLGLGVGYGLFRAGGWVVVALRPQFWVSLSGTAALTAVVAAGLMAVLASIVPTRRIARLDPATVYRG